MVLELGKIRWSATEILYTSRTVIIADRTVLNAVRTHKFEVTVKI